MARRQYKHIQKRRANVAALVLLGVTLVAVGVTVWALFFNRDDSLLAPDYAPVELEPYAEPMADSGKDKLETTNGGGAVMIEFLPDVYIDISENIAKFYFANPDTSLEDMVLQLVIQDKLFFQTGTLKPGNQITTQPLLEGVADRLSPGGYDGKLVASFYDPDTGEKANVNSDIPVTITVVE